MRTTQWIVCFLCSFCTGLSSDSWTGVWRIVALQGHSSSVYQLAVAEKDEPKVELYDEMGKPFSVKEGQFNGSDLKLIAIFSDVKSLPLSFMATREAGRLTGQWTFVHPQFQYGGKIVGVRVMEPARWSPFEKLREREKGPLIDIAGFLLEKAPRKHLADFIHFWRQEVHPVFYFFFQRQIYGDGLDPELAERELARLFQSIRDSDTAHSLVRDLPRLATETASDLHRRLGQGFDVGPKLVSSIASEAVSRITLWSRPATPEEGPRRCCSQRIVELLAEDYLILDPLRFAAQKEWAGTLVRREILLSSLGNKGGSNPTRMLQPALALYLALAAEGREFPALQESELSFSRKELRAILEKESEVAMHEHYGISPQSDLFGCSTCAVRVELAGRLLSEHGLRALLAMNEAESKEAFLRALEGDEETSSEKEPEG